jgi:hypothetical protein
MFPVGTSVRLDAVGRRSSSGARAAAHASEPVSWLPAFDGWLVNRYGMTVEGMRDAATFTVGDPRFSSAQVIGPSMLSLDGAEHDRHRTPGGGYVDILVICANESVSVSSGLVPDRLELV